MTERLPSGVLVSAMLRRVNDAGGFGMVRARGDAQGGAILLIVSEPGRPERVLERGVGPEGTPMLIESMPPGDIEDYWRRRRLRDPDLWVVALDIAGAERFAAETMTPG